LERGQDRSIRFGGEHALCEAVGRGADVRIGTAFHHNEHIDTDSTNAEVVREAAEFPVTYLIAGRWVAGIMTLRQPISLPDGFGPRPSMSFFLYNQDGRQAIARPYLDGGEITAAPGPSAVNDHVEMPKYHELDAWDAGTNAPSSNFIYDFDVFQYWVRDQWEEVLSHTADGTVVTGSVDALADAFLQGREVKVGISGLCDDLASGSAEPLEHQLFVQTGSCYYYTEAKLFIAGSHPVVRVRPAIPLAYTSGGWDFGWLMLRTDGLVVKRICDPYTLRFSDSKTRKAIRWFAS